MKAGSKTLRMVASAAAVAATVAATVGTTAAGASTKGIPAAKRAVAALEKRPEHLPSTQAVGKAIPTGKTFDWLQCSLPTCTILTPPLEAAAAKLGWTIKVVPAGITPETVKNAWDVAVRDHPDGVFASGFPKTIFATELAQLKADNIPVVDLAVGTTSGTGLTAIIQGNNTNHKIGLALADWVLAQKGKAANTLLISSSTFSTLAKIEQGFSGEYKRLCSSCALGTLNEPATTFGTSLPNDVVAYLKTHPKVNYVVPDESAMNTGLPQALASAGLSKQVGIVSQYPSTTTVQYLKSGQMNAIVMPQMVDSMWQMADAMARQMAGVSVVPAEAPSPLWMVTPKTAGKLTTPYFLVPNYQEKYQQLWGVK
ncbi:MAG TPA: substrate-binding domain-containing protein [Acidimicrobiales bacterium]|nr:substrate-binding domain-containing protein [Acidimicrobiales bacterium]